MRLDVHRARHVVARAHDIVHQLVSQVVLLFEDAEQVVAHELSVVPEMVVTIDNLEVGLKRLLPRLRVPRLELRLAGEPGLTLLQ